MTRSQTLHRAESRSGVLLALLGDEQPSASLQRALELASRLREPLHVLRVHTPKHALHRVLERILGVGRPTPALRQSHAATRRWLMTQMGGSSRAVRVSVSTGEFVEQVAIFARQARARLLVISPALPNAGGAATALAQKCGAQVLIARGKSHASPILAATDLQDPSFPVLRSAAAVARLLKRPLVAFHNVDPLSVMSGRTAVLTGVVLGGASATTRRESLVSVSRALHVEPTPVLRTELDPVHAILDEADVCDASLIVVGTYHASWWARWMNESVAARVAGQAARAVLITPISDGGAASPLAVG